MRRPVDRIVFTAVVALAAAPGASACAVDSYMGSVCTFAFSYGGGGPAGCPSGGWAPADGAFLPISGNEKLFELLRTTYGGDGVGTFALPDLRGRVANNAGAGPGLAEVRIGETYGTEELVLAVANLPAHDHVAKSEPNIQATLRAQNAGGNKSVPSSNVPATFSTTSPEVAPPAGIYGYTYLGADVDMHASAIATDAKVTTTTDVTGGGRPFSNMQATLVMYQCIRINGPVPPRP